MGMKFDYGDLTEKEVAEMKKKGLLVEKSVIKAPESPFKGHTLKPGDGVAYETSVYKEKDIQFAKETAKNVGELIKTIKDKEELKDNTKTKIFVKTLESYCRYFEEKVNPENKLLGPGGVRYTGKELTKCMQQKMEFFKQEFPDIGEKIFDVSQKINKDIKHTSFYNIEEEAEKIKKTM